MQITKISDDTEAANGRSMALQYLEAGKNRKRKWGKRVNSSMKTVCGSSKKNPIFTYPVSDVVIKC